MTIAPFYKQLSCILVKDIGVARLQSTASPSLQESTDCPATAICTVKPSEDDTSDSMMVVFPEWWDMPEIPETQRIVSAPETHEDPCPETSTTSTGRCGYAPEAWTPAWTRAERMCEHWHRQRQARESMMEALVMALESQVWSSDE
ncbi:hypothetical protein Y1Q_0024582 [Alligator mississippiensis]|uniref:Uncharacterized protein n=1 Tax=Alligator mississippiensis TaxID=8496 RepID=A0A151NAZ1_ALLMI|nr:hypothetical protein Y1Q_0024582 [Alligator mississippiensis]